MFFLDHHLSHAYATFVFLPFFLAISAVHGLLVKYSGSIRPSVLLHALADRGLRRGLATLCLGGGDAVALSVTRP